MLLGMMIWQMKFDFVMKVSKEIIYQNFGF